MGSLLLLRKVRVFNKSRYARNRQLARVIFYFGLYINLLVIYGSFSMLYGFVFKFNHAIWIVYAVCSCFVVPAAYRVWNLIRMLQYLLSWKLYRSLKSGLLLDYYTKRIFLSATKHFTSVFTIFFTDKYTLEHLFAQILKQMQYWNNLIFLKKTSIIAVLKTIILCQSYLVLIVAIIYL
jgi:hypothetical protein